MAHSVTGAAELQTPDAVETEVTVVSPPFVIYIVEAGKVVTDPPFVTYTVDVAPCKVSVTVLAEQTDVEP